MKPGIIHVFCIWTVLFICQNLMASEKTVKITTSCRDFESKDVSNCAQYAKNIEEHLKSTFQKHSYASVSQNNPSDLQINVEIEKNRNYFNVIIKGTDKSPLMFEILGSPSALEKTIGDIVLKSMNFPDAGPAETAETTTRVTTKKSDKKRLFNTFSIFPFVISATLTTVTGIMAAYTYSVHTDRYYKVSSKEADLRSDEELDNLNGLKKLDIWLIAGTSAGLLTTGIFLFLTDFKNPLGKKQKNKSISFIPRVTPLKKIFSVNLNF